MIADEFGVTYSPEDCADVTNLGKLIELLDARAALAAHAHPQAARHHAVS